ncbi:dihydroxy-acid dehydratase ilv3 [Nowakowskiella sp. JEL0407]|nr:dihydroxy-acid dehydratase ilv3 [Nowakowskiella sp. JEL0407]
MIFKGISKVLQQPPPKDSSAQNEVRPSLQTFGNQPLQLNKHRSVFGTSNLLKNKRIFSNTTLSHSNNQEQSTQSQNKLDFTKVNEKPASNFILSAPQIPQPKPPTSFRPNTLHPLKPLNSNIPSIPKFDFQAPFQPQKPALQTTPPPPTQSSNNIITNYPVNFNQASIQQNHNLRSPSSHSFNERQQKSHQQPNLQPPEVQINTVKQPAQITNLQPNSNFSMNSKNRFRPAFTGISSNQPPKSHQTAATNSNAPNQQHVLIDKSNSSVSVVKRKRETVEEEEDEVQFDFAEIPDILDSPPPPANLNIVKGKRDIAEEVDDDVLFDFAEIPDTLESPPPCVNVVKRKREIVEEDEDEDLFGLDNIPDEYLESVDFKVAEGSATTNTKSKPAVLGAKDIVEVANTTERSIRAPLQKQIDFSPNQMGTPIESPTRKKVDLRPNKSATSSTINDATSNARSDTAVDAVRLPKMHSPIKIKPPTTPQNPLRPVINPKSVRKFPGPAGEISVEDDVEQLIKEPNSATTSISRYFASPKRNDEEEVKFQPNQAWVNMLDVFGRSERTCISDVWKPDCPSKIPFMCVMIVELKQSAVELITVRFCDPTGNIHGSIHHYAFDAFSDITMGSVLELRQLHIRKKMFRFATKFGRRAFSSKPSDVPNRVSSRVTQVKAQGASQAMLYAVGLTPETISRAQVGISSVWYEGNPCNMHLMDLAQKVKEGVQKAGLNGFRFNTIGVSDGLSMGTEGMCYSLQSREIIADSIETV